MKKIVINRLFQSFKELEKAIGQAKESLRSKDNVPLDVIARVEMYEEILEKQKTLATAMCGYASLGEWEEVARHIKLINGLSFMIRDDARDIVSKASQATTEAHHGIALC